MLCIEKEVFLKHPVRLVKPYIWLLSKRSPSWLLCHSKIGLPGCRMATED